MYDASPGPAGSTDYKPLYTQVKELLVKRIGSGDLKPGELLPSEFQLAAQYNVSQGTVRKALIEMESERLIVRRQGRGSYVAQHTTEETLFHFFRIVGLDDKRCTPVSLPLSQRLVRASKDQAAHLAVPAGTPLHGIVRVRSFKGRPTIHERVFVPAALMPELDISTNERMTEELYVIYQERFGVTVAHATERLAAVSATAEDSRRLMLQPGAPLLEIVRVARDVTGMPVELRVSRCDTSITRYAAEVV